MRRLSLKLRPMAPFRMSLSRRAVLALPAFAALPAYAETWPSKPVHIVVPFAPGGSGDITARLVGKYMEDKTGQPFVIENKAGANGIVGVLSVKSSVPDGYTLMLATTSTNAANIHMYKSPGYDPEKDFTVVGIIGDSGAFLVVPADSPHKSMADLIAYAKAHPGKLNFGYFNASSQVPSEVLGKQAGLEWQGVAYKAIGNAWNDLYAGAIQFMFVDLTRRADRSCRRRRGRSRSRCRAQPALSRRAGAGRDVPGLHQHRLPRGRSAEGGARGDQATAERADQRGGFLRGHSQAPHRGVRAHAAQARPRAMRRAGPQRACEVGRLRQDRQDRTAMTRRACHWVGP